MAPLIAAALGLAPALVELLAGRKAGDLATAATEAIAGTSDPERIKDLPPEKQAELRATLAQIALQERQAVLADVQHARETGAKTSLIAWAQVGFASAILLLFAALLILMLFRGAPEDQSGLFYYAMGILSAATTAVISFFFGNATSANAANARIDRIAASAVPVLATTASLNDASLTAARSQR